MDIKADITYLSNGQLDTARNIVLCKTFLFDDLMEVYEWVSDDVFYEIEQELTKRALDKWREDMEDQAEHKIWDSRR